MSSAYSSDIIICSNNYVTCYIIYDIELLEEAVDIATKTKASGFDVIFIACSKLTNSTLITDDLGMHRAATSFGIDSKLLREM